MIAYANNSKAIVVKAYIKRIVLVFLLLDAARNSKPSDFVKEEKKELWDLIYESLIILNGGKLLASIGSQGFLSIPLYRMETKEGDVEILRLHIWDKTLDKFIDNKAVSDFSIHSHKFYARSWILCGEVLNTNYELDDKQEGSDLSYFKISWANSTFDAKDNSRKSTLLNTEIQVNIKNYSFACYRAGNSYEICAGEFHKSAVNPDFDITSTLFLFSTQYGEVEHSFVLGPKDLKQAPKHNYSELDAMYLLRKLNISIRSNG